MSTSACDKCARPVVGDGDAITCMAFCDRAVHLSCTGTTSTKLNKPFAKIVSENPNLLWMCDECAKLMKMATFKSAISSVGDAINAITAKQESVHNEIKQQLTKQGQQIAQLSKRINSGTPTTALSSSSRPPAFKRRREDELPTTKPLIGTKVMADTNVITVPQPVELFWVYLSRIHPSVKTDAIEKLVKECLQGVDTVQAVPLLKRDADTSRMRFISYKVGVDPKFRDVALSSDTWPQGILFREFEDHSSKNMWLPQLNTPTVEVTLNAGPSRVTTPLSHVDLTC